MKRTSAGGPGEGASASRPTKQANIEKVVRPPPRSIAVYNYKGGCCKTFLSRELAAALVKLELKVGLIDLDGQCNLTTWLLGGGIEGPEQDNGGRRDDDEQPFYDADEDLSEDDLEAEGEEQVDNIGEVTLDVLPRGKVWQYPLDPEHTSLDISVYRQDNLSNNIYETMQKAFKGGSFYTDPLEGLVKIEPIPRAAQIKGGELWLLPGSRRVIKLESKFNYASNPDTDELPNLLAFRSIINKMQREKGLDVVIVDCSPSSGILNKVCVMSCDMVLPPAKPDTHNLSSLHGMLTAVLPMWLAYRATIMYPASRKYQALGDGVLTLPREPPRLLPMALIGFTATALRGTRAGRSRAEEVEKFVYKGASSWTAALVQMVKDVEQDAEAPLDPALSDIDKIDAKENKKLMQRVVAMLNPEIVVQNGVEEKVYVWASVQGLIQVLDHSATDRWPVCWMADDADKTDFNSARFARLKPGRQKIKVAGQRQAENVLKALDSISRFVCSVKVG